MAAHSGPLLPHMTTADSARDMDRIREAVGLADVELFVVTCPKDVTMYEDAIKTSGNADRIELRELTELIEEALVASPALAPA